MTLDTELADELCGLYIDIDASRRVVGRAQLDAKRIAFRDVAQENWSNILAEARATDGGMLALLRAARGDFPDNAKLREVQEFLIANPPPSPPPAARRKRALLVGVGEYSEGLPALPAANPNVEALKQLLEQPSFGFHVDTLANPSKQQLLDALEALFLVADRNDLLVFYYAGHLLLTDKLAVYLTARDTIAQPQNLTARALAFANLEQDFLGESKAQILLLFDACWSQAGTARYGELSQDVVNGALDTYLGRGCDKVLVASGAGADPSAWQGKRSPLTASILSALRRDDAATGADGVLTAEELIHAVDEDNRSSDAGGRPIHKALHISPARMELRGCGRAIVELKPDEQRFVARLKPAIEQGLVIPFFGDGVYGNGPLSFSGLAAELAMQAGLGSENRDDVGLATVAESLELERPNRRSFLDSLRRVIDDQTAHCSTPVAYDLLRDLKPPWLAVTVNYDSLLERQLDAAGAPYVLLSHVLRVLPDEDPETERQPRTFDEPAAGHPSAMMLVVRSKNHPAVKVDPAREVELRTPGDLGTDSDTDCIVYHLLGAPFLNDLPFARDRRLDTVAISETDYIELLTKLRGKSTGVPSALVSRWFRMKKLLFLEYHLDVWHYRLLGHVFRNKAGGADGSVAIEKPYVVRVEPSRMEQSFWQRFNPDRVSLDLKTLVRALHPGGRP